MDAFDHQQKDLIAAGETDFFPSQYLLLNIPSVILSMALKSRASSDTPTNIRRSGFPIKNHCLGVLY